MEKGIQGNISPGIGSTPGSGVDSTDFVRQNPMLAIPVDSSPQGRKMFSGSIPCEEAPILSLTKTVLPSVLLTVLLLLTSANPVVKNVPFVSNGSVTAPYRRAANESAPVIIPALTHLMGSASTLIPTKTFVFIPVFPAVRSIGIISTVTE